MESAEEEPSVQKPAMQEENKSNIKSEPAGDRPPHRFRVPPAPPGGICSGCGSAEISCLPTYSVGSGLGQHPLADDVYCRKCGQIAPVHFEKL